jgi:SlyX protein
VDEPTIGDAHCPGWAGAEFASNSAMTNPQDIDARLTDLEVKASFTEDLVEHLNQIVARQQRQIDLLTRELGQLQQQSSEGATVRSLRDELPPHY